MWNRPYSFKEGAAITLGLILTGILLQLSMGPLDWDVFMWPANLIALILFVSILTVLHLLRKHSYFIRFMTTGRAAVPALIGVLLLTLIMGLTRQVGQTAPPADPLAFTKMLESWPFILLYVWMTAIVGEVSLVQIAHLSRRNICSLLSHLGLFVALTCGSLGSADMQRLKMYCEQGRPEWRGLDAWDNVHELPLAVELQRFIIDEYPPKLMVIDNAGKALPYDKPQVLEVAQGVTGGRLLGWDIKIEKQIDNAMPVPLAKMAKSMSREMAIRIQMDSVGVASNKEGYTATSLPGTECALLVCASRAGQSRENVAKGWVTCGSYQFMYQALQLDAGHSLVMASREPSRYASRVTIYTEDEQVIQGEIAVNHPLTVKGWKIYQLGYNQQMGKWSTLSILELVRDPWLPTVYLGILLIGLGALGMLFRRSKDKATDTCERATTDNQSSQHSTDRIK